MRLFHALLAGLSCLTLPAAAAAGDEVDVDLELVLAVDVSRSMDAEEQTLQKEGYLAALQHPEVIAAIRSGFLGRIAVTYVEWAGPGRQRIIAPWSVIDSADSGAVLADGIAGQPVSYMRATSISSALIFSADLFHGNGFRSPRQVIDISGDGPNNMGIPVLDARDVVLGRGITINGLPVMLNTSHYGGYSIPDLDVYYEDCVIGGPGAFLITVTSMERFAEAVRRKLVLEIARAEPEILPAAMHGKREPRIDCLIGEKLRRRWIDP